jgi:hypothetical protein
VKHGDLIERAPDVHEVPFQRQGMGACPGYLATSEVRGSNAGVITELSRLLGDLIESLRLLRPPVGRIGFAAHDAIAPF